MELLEKIWDDAPGQRAILYRKAGDKKNKGRNEFFTDLASAYEFACKKNKQGFEVWFAPALFGEEPKRTQTNAISVKSFWLDIDAEADKPYANINDAAIALASFCDAVGLPLPTLVSSGRGLHAHWIIDTRISKDRWEATAKSLKVACTRLGLKAGPERTADIASVLRIPGTKHLKEPTEPKPVSVIGEIQPVVSLVDFEKAVARFAPLNSARQANKVFEIDYPQLPHDANKIADGCGIIGRVRETRGCVSEPIWMHTLQLLHSCVDGEKFAHEWSNGHPEYDEEACQEKFDSKAGIGPTLCATFNDKWTDGDSPCLTCTYRTRISTPLQLGTTVTNMAARDGVVPSAETPVAEISDDSSTPVPREATESLTFPYYVPRLYLVGEEGTFYSDPDRETPLRILDIALGLKSINSVGREAQFVFEWKNSTGEFCESEMTGSTLTELRALDSWLVNNYITGFNPHQLDALRIYMRACVTERRKREKPIRSYEHNGWVDDTKAFVLGPRIIKPNGIFPAQMANVPQSIQDGLCEAGDFETWAKTTELIAHGDNYMPHRFTMAAAFGSILFKHIKAKGAVLSLAGADSGTGKTTISKFAVSAFGHPDATQLPSDSTIKSFSGTWVMNGSLPTLVDEITQLDRSVLKAMTYAAGKGQGRRRMSRQGKLIDAEGWQCLTIVTTNEPLLDFPEKDLKSANKMRILEFTLTKDEHEMPQDVGVPMDTVSETHYGIAGRMFIEEVVRRHDEIAMMTAKLNDSFVAGKPGSVPGKYRFSKWIIVCALVAGRICEEMGILRFDTEAACRWANENLSDRAKEAAASESNVQSAVSDYIRSHQGSFTHYQRKNRFWSNEFRGECFGKYTTEPDGNTVTLSVPVGLLIEHCRSHGVDKSQLSRWSKEKKVEIKTVQLVPQGDAQNEQGMTSRCYVIPINGENHGRD